MSAVTVIGTGNMGSAIAALAAKGGAAVQVLGHEPGKAESLATIIGGTAGTIGDTITGDVVVLAVYYPVVAEVVAMYRTQLSGKTVVDITNTADFQTMDGRILPEDTSAGEQLASLLPDAHVVKAFNTTLAATLTSGQVGGVPTTVIIAGDDDAAKAAVRSFVEAGGLAVVDAGGLKRSRELEAMGFLQMALAVREQITWAGGFAVRH